MKPEFSRKILERRLNIKFHENPSSVSQVVFMRTDGRTDRHNEAEVAFRNFANAPKYTWFLEI
jgi:hypothetical protein